VHGALKIGGRCVSASLEAARQTGGQVMEFSKSSWYDRQGKVVEVQRVAEGMGVLLDDDIAEVMAYQLAEDQDGFWVEKEVEKLRCWQAETGQEWSVEVVGELCSRGRLGPVAWAKGVVTRERSRRDSLDAAQVLIDQGADLMELTGVLLKQAHTALVFKVLDDRGANEGEIAAVLGWANPRRCFPFRRDHRRATAPYLRALCESALQWRERVLQGGVSGVLREQLMLLASEVSGELDPFELV